MILSSLTAAAQYRLLSPPGDEARRGVRRPQQAERGSRAGQSVPAKYLISTSRLGPESRDYCSVLCRALSPDGYSGQINLLIAVLFGSTRI